LHFDLFYFQDYASFFALLSSCKPELVLEFANVISYWDRFIITDKAVDFNRPDIVLIHKENKTATLHIAVPFTHKLPKTEGEKIMNYEHLDLDIKNIWKHKCIYIPLSHLTRRRGHQKLPKISRELWFKQEHLNSGAESSTLANVSYSTQIPRTRPLTLGDRVNFFPLTEPNPTNCLG